MTSLFKAGEVPQIRKITALLRLHGLHGTVVAFEKNALTIGLLRQRKAAAILPQSCVTLNELVLRDQLQICHPGNLAVAKTYLARPPTTGGASLTFMEDWHRQMIAGLGIHAKTQHCSVSIHHLHQRIDDPSDSQQTAPVIIPVRPLSLPHGCASPGIGLFGQQSAQASTPKNAS